MLRVPPAPVAGGGVDHGADHLRVLAHTKIIVGAPHHDLLRPIRRMPDGVREAAGDALEISEHAVTPLAMEPPQRIGKKGVVVDLGIPMMMHEVFSSVWAGSSTWCSTE